jgi:hypothetical protein
MFCPRCGNRNPDDAPACSQCGYGLGEAAAKLAEPPRESVRTPPAQPRIGTMLGVAVVPEGAIAPPAPFTPAQPPPSRQQPKGTMLGVAVVPEGAIAPPVAFTPAAPAPPPVSARAPHPSVPEAAPTSAAASYNALRPAGTLGFAMPPPVPQTAPTAHAATPDAAPFTPRRMVAELVSRHGQALLADPARCAAALIEDYQRQVSLLVAALEHGVPQRLLAMAQQAPIEASVNQLSHELAHSLGIPTSGAKWAVESWALSFQLMLPHERKG